MTAASQAIADRLDTLLEPIDAAPQPLPRFLTVAGSSETQTTIAVHAGLSGVAMKRTICELLKGGHGDESEMKLHKIENNGDGIFVELRSDGGERFTVHASESVLFDRRSFAEGELSNIKARRDEGLAIEGQFASLFGSTSNNGKARPWWQPATAAIAAVQEKLGIFSHRY